MLPSRSDGFIHSFIYSFYSLSSSWITQEPFSQNMTDYTNQMLTSAGPHVIILAM